MDDTAADWDRGGAEFLRVGVEGRELDREAGTLKFTGICGLELGVEGLELCVTRGFSTEELVWPVRIREGVEGREVDERADGVEGLAVDEDRVMGEDGLIWDDTEAELVLRIEDDLFDE